MRRELVRLLDIAPDLLEPSPSSRHDRIVVEALTVRRRSRPSLSDAAQLGTHGLLVVDGFVVRQTSLVGFESVELYGPGDALWLTPDDSAPKLVGAEDRWWARTDARLVELGTSFDQAACEFPRLNAAVAKRFALVEERVRARHALLRSPSVAVRLLGVLWLYGAQWGRVRPDGVAVVVPISQGLLAGLLAAHRTTVNQALRDLTTRDALQLLGDDEWLLRRSLDDTGPSPRDAFRREHVS